MILTKLRHWLHPNPAKLLSPNGFHIRSHTLQFAEMGSLTVEPGRRSYSVNLRELTLAILPDQASAELFHQTLRYYMSVVNSLPNGGAG